MEEKKFVNFKKEELGVKEYIKKSLGKGKISNVSIEYTPVGEKIVVATSKPGLVIGRGGEKIEELTRVLKKRFHLDNPHVDIQEIFEPYLDAQLVADEIAIVLERRGHMQYKIVAYRMLEEIIKAGALGVEIVLSGRLPSDRARTWRFAKGYLKKTGEPAKLVKRAQAQAKTIPGVVGIQVSILTPDTVLHDKIKVDDELRKKIQENAEPNKEELEEEPEKKSKKKKPTKKKSVKEDKKE
jgi:small subunit ribosomal protein S3